MSARSRGPRRLRELLLVAVAWVILLALGGCGDDSSGSGAGPESQALADARQRWQAAGITEYAFTATRSCECPEEVAGPIRVRVVDGVVVARSYFGTPTDAGPGSVEDIFDEIEASIGRGERVAVDYGANTGVPTSVRLDLDSIPADGGLVLQLESLISYDSLRSELASARELWAEAEMTDYELRYLLRCFCPEIVVTVEVRDSRMVGHMIEGAATTEFFGTVEELFGEVEDAIDGGAFSIEVEYDQVTGHPVNLFVDEEEFVFDEEHGVEVESLTRL